MPKLHGAKMREYAKKIAKFMRGTHYHTMSENNPERSVGSTTAPMNGEASDTVGARSTSSSTPWSKSNVRCATCGGTGWVGKEEEGQLVALIPLSDQRLKPRRTLIYVALAIGLCALTGGLCGFFLFPRDVTFLQDRNFTAIKPEKVISNNDSVSFDFKTHITMENNNFYATPIKRISASAMVEKLEIAKSNWVASDGDSPTIPARSKTNVLVTIPIEFNATTPDLLKRCKSADPWTHILFIDIVLNVAYSGMGHNQEVPTSFYRRVMCYPTEPT